jgi:hypothetical protein
LSGVEAGQSQQVANHALHPYRMPRNRLEKLPRVLGIRGAVQQRLHVPANGRERRAQLVGDIGDEVAPHLICAPEVGDVMQHENGAREPAG